MANAFKILGGGNLPAGLIWTKEGPWSDPLPLTEDEAISLRNSVAIEHPVFGLLPNIGPATWLNGNPEGMTSRGTAFGEIMLDESGEYSTGTAFVLCEDENEDYSLCDCSM